MLINKSIEKNQMQPISLLQMLSALLVLTLHVAASAQSTDSVKIRIMSYNMDSLNANSGVRSLALRGVVSFEQPTILVAQSVTDSRGVEWLWGVFSHGDLPKMAPRSELSHSVLMYDSAVVVPISHNLIPTASLPIDEWIMYIPSTSDTFIIASCEFVSGLDSASQAERSLQAQALRVHLHQRRNLNVFVAGTMNFTATEEQGYKWLNDDAPFGDSLLRNPLYDPANIWGTWHHNSDSVIARWHTFSPRVDTTLDTSGLVDRFDLILLSSNLLGENFVASSYEISGNLGVNFGKSVTLNGQITSRRFRQLYDGSTHLPIHVDLVFRKHSSGVRNSTIAPSEMDLSTVSRRIFQSDIYSPSFGCFTLCPFSTFTAR